MEYIGNIEEIKRKVGISLYHKVKNSGANHLIKNKLDISQTKIRKLAGERISKGDIIKLKTNGFIKSDNVKFMSSMFHKNIWTDSKNDLKKIFDETYFWNNLAPDKESRGYVSIHDTGLFD